MRISISFPVKIIAVSGTGVMNMGIWTEIGLTALLIAGSLAVVYYLYRKEKI
jgi:hypothetical protein